jgi:two-component system chemotaxis response regulator CheY
MRTILTVDDSPTVRQQIKALLESSGMQVLEATDGADGLQKAKDNKIDLLLVDVNMPVMDGISMVKEVRKIGAYAKTPIFILTTESGAAAAKSGKEAGATAWIIKPFKPQILLRGIQQMLAS